MTATRVLFRGGHIVPEAAPAIVPPDPRQGFEWLWVHEGRVAGAGAGAPPEIDAPAIDLAGGVLVPAFADAHVHWAWLATALLGPELSSCTSATEVLARVDAWTEPGRGERGEWIVGTGFDESAWRDHRLPSRADLDRIAPRRPVLIQRVCGHIGVANSLALARTTPGPHTDAASGRIAEDDLYALVDLVRPSAEVLAAVIPDVVRLLHAHGITAVHDVSAPEMVQAFALAARRGQLDVRVTCSVPARYLDFERQGEGEFFAARGLADLPLGGPDAPFEVLGVKLFVDGSLGARTACLRAPYADDPTRRGVALYTDEALGRIARTVDASGLQLMVHAIGDAALEQALQVLAPHAAGGNPRRHRLEHVEVTPPDLVERLARAGLWVCAQPNFAGRWSRPGGMNEQRLGSRLAHCNAYRTLLEAGIPMAFGSDCMPLGPLYGIRSAIEHPLHDERIGAVRARELYSSAVRRLTASPQRRAASGEGAASDFALLGDRPESGVDWDALRVEGVFRILRS